MFVCFRIVQLQCTVDLGTTVTTRKVGFVFEYIYRKRVKAGRYDVVGKLNGL